MTRRCFRYVPFTISQDLTAWPEYSAVCVSGDVSECGAGSGRLTTPAAVEEWMRRHTQTTDHLRYERGFHDYAELAPQDDGEVWQVIRGSSRAQSTPAIESESPFVLGPVPDHPRVVACPNGGEPLLADPYESGDANSFYCEKHGVRYHLKPAHPNYLPVAPLEAGGGARD
ncbi:hypothetical protein GCM10009544_18480 [Streptomyces stramineus]|uniref:DUF7848 domain-containing protein n=1 Tax=Streptomyces stramineus TaxID=173861 RepID=A0ABP3JLZ4_9ACTN